MTERIFTATASFAQEQLWFLDQLLPGQGAYNMAGAVRLRGALVVGALERALGAIVLRHEALRTIFREVDGVPVQVVADPHSFSLGLVDAIGETDGLRTRMAEEAARGFDLECGPLFRAVLYRVGADEHVLLLLMHHIVSDAWSVEVLLGDLAVLYGDFVRGREASLPELPIQYADYAEWQRDQLRGEALETQLGYWRDQLSEAPQVLELSTDRPRPPIETHRGALFFFPIPRELSDGVTVLARREGATMFMTLLAAFQVLLGRYTGQEDLLVGTPVTNRSRTELEGMIGLFVNTLVLRGDLSGDPTVRELLGRVRETCLGAYAHQDLPMERLVEELRPTRDLSRNPLFQVMLVLNNKMPFEAHDMPGLSVTPMDVDRGASQFDLTLYVEERPEGLRGTFEYATDLFDESTLARMAGHWQTILAGMIASPECRVAELPLLTEDERQRLLVEWNDTGAAVPAVLVHELVEAQVARTPERVAVTAGETIWSYAELDARATRLAQTLRARGVGRGQLVGLCIERSADMIAALLGILKAGAAYLPLDPSFPAERLRFMADDAQLALLVSTAALADAFSLPRERQLLVDADAEAIASAPVTRLPVDSQTAQPGDPSHIIYTSGSTGKPKGVVIPHRAAVNLFSSLTREPGLSASDRLVAVTTLSFDIAAVELLLPLMVGAQVILASRDEASDGEALRALLESSHATVLQGTPATWRLLLDAGWTGTADFLAMTGGESLSPDLAEALLARTGALWNLYGPTETTVYSTGGLVTHPRAGISIGRPVANTTVRVLDGNRQLCPIGVPGELYIGGAGVAIGYLHRAELTAERFLPDPFAATPMARLYRTGDRGRWLANGTLEHLGRLDFQVKVRGFRIELGEIEAALADHEAVRQAVVAARGSSPEEARLIAYVTLLPGHAATGSELRRFLRGILPEYMVPNAFVELDEFPRTPNGKVDRKALPSAGEQRSAEGDFIAPRSKIEKTVADVWQEVLGVTRISVRDNFFELGGHSLLAAQMVARLARCHGYRVGLRSVIFESLEQLAAGAQQQ
jgi:amino acid adenylation domain-containing protein